MARALGARALIRSVRVSLRENVAVEDGKCPMAAHGQEVLAHNNKTTRRVSTLSGSFLRPNFFWSVRPFSLPPHRHLSCFFCPHTIFITLLKCAHVALRRYQQPASLKSLTFATSWIMVMQDSRGVLRSQMTYASSDGDILHQVSVDRTFGTGNLLSTKMHSDEWLLLSWMRMDMAKYTGPVILLRPTSTPFNTQRTVYCKTAQNRIMGT